jgi:hypothetical protein
MARSAPIMLDVMRAAVPLNWQRQASLKPKRRLGHPTRAEATQPSKLCLCLIECDEYLSELCTPGYTK